MSFRFRLAAVALLVSLALPLSAAAQQKIAVVDLQRIVLEVKEGKAAKASHDKWLAGKQQEMNKRQEALRKEQAQLEGQADALSPAERQKRENDLQRKALNLAQDLDKTRTEAAAREQKAMKPILDKAHSVIAEIAARDGLDLVLDKRSTTIVYVRNPKDLTDEVIRKMDAAKK